MDRQDDLEEISIAFSRFIRDFGLLDQKNINKVINYVDILLAEQKAESLSAATSGRDGVSVAEVREVAHTLRCSFCGKSDRQAQRMIQGPGVCICDECVHLCQLVLQEPYDLGDAPLDGETI